MINKGIVIWLILPVVICLSQRLSHACLSINNSVLVKLRMAHNSVKVLNGVIRFFTDNRSNIELTHANTSNRKERRHLLDYKPIHVKMALGDS